MRRSVASTFAVVTTVVLTAVSIAPEVDADAATVETALLQAINTGRANVGKKPLVMHEGLRNEQRGHAQHMAEIGRLTHDGFGDRARRATPDPVESNGAPDDGFSGTVAENVAFHHRNGQSDTDIAQTLYELWLNSPGHRSAMFDEDNAGFNVAGLGVFEDGGGRVWAALLLTIDRTPPGGGTSEPPKKRRCKRNPRRCRR